MAYAAAVSVVQILKQFLKTNHYSFQYPKPEIETLYGKVCFLQSFLEKVYPVPREWREEGDDVENRIRDSMYRIQDTIEFFISRQIRPSESKNVVSEQRSSLPVLKKSTRFSPICCGMSGQTSSSKFNEIPAEESPISHAMEQRIAELDSIIDKAEHIANLVYNDTGKSKHLFLKLSESTTENIQITRQEKCFGHVKDALLSDYPQLQIITIYGVGGIGKTTLAKSIYDDPQIQSRFSTRAWVAVSQECQVGEILLKLSDSMESEGKRVRDKGSVEQLSAHLHQTLINTRYLIVLDDVCDRADWEKIKSLFPVNWIGSRILLTTRKCEVAAYIKSSPSSYPMGLLEPGESWTLLSRKVIGCPSHLKEIGMRIAGNCLGLPLFISVVGGILSKGRKDIEYWNIIEEDTRNAVRIGKDGHTPRLFNEGRDIEDWSVDKRMEVYLAFLSLSYKHLPAELKGCFMYMGGFPEDSEIPATKLIKLWIAEGFIVPPSPPMTLEQVAHQYLEELTDRNLILIHKRGSGGGIKTCGIHDDLRLMAMKESQRNNFFYILNRHDRVLEEGTQTERRVFVQKNVLMCMKDVQKRMKSNKVVRTLVYTGLDYHHPLTFCVTFELLRVLDALAVYFMEFPVVLVKLIHLRYLGLTFGGTLPPSLSKLLNLQTLILHRHPNFIFIDTSILPVEVWMRMLQMRHLLIPEFDLPLPSSGAHSSVFLENLQSLSNINAASCTKEILRSMPNLKKLGMWLESSSPVHFYLDQLQQLEALKFTVLNPIHGKSVDFLPQLAFPKTLRNLTLSGCGIPWKDMTVIGTLPCLQVLKLRDSAFQGPEWRPEARQFLELKFLQLEYLDLVSLLADRYNFPCLERLIIRHCYELEKIENDIGFVPTLQLIQLVNCSADVIKQESFGHERLQVRIIASWE